MKKLIIIAAIFLTGLWASAQPKYLLMGKWAGADITSVSDSVKNILGNNYELTIFDIRVLNDQEMYTYTDYTSTKDITMTLRSGTNSQGQKFIASIIFYGAYGDVFKIFKNMFAPNADIEAVKSINVVPTFGILNKKVRVIDDNAASKPGEVVVHFHNNPGEEGWNLVIEEPNF